MPELQPHDAEAEAPADVACGGCARGHPEAEARAQAAGDSSTSGGVVAGLLARTESAEKRAETSEKIAAKAQAEVRKLRAELHAVRAEKTRVEERAAQAELALEGADDPEACASRLQAEDRATRAETEVLRLHCELQAFRTAMLGECKSLSITPTPQKDSPDDFGGNAPAKYGAIACCRYSCGCLHFYLVRLCVCLVTLLCGPLRWSRNKALHIAGKAAPTPVQEVDAQGV